MNNNDRFYGICLEIKFWHIECASIGFCYSTRKMYVDERKKRKKSKNHFNEKDALII